MKNIGCIICTLILLQTGFPVKAQEDNLFMPEDFRVCAWIPLEKGSLPGNFKEVHFDIIHKYEPVNGYDSLMVAILNRMFSGDIDIYSPAEKGAYYPYGVELQTDTISVNDFIHNAGGYKEDLALFDEETGEMKTVMATHDPDLKEVKSVVFTETWNFDPEKFVFRKNVIAYEPVRHYFREDDLERQAMILRKTGRLIFNKKLSKKEIKKSDKRMQLCAKVAYEFPFKHRYEHLQYLKSGHSEIRDYPFENPDAPFLNSIVERELLNTLYEAVINEQVKAYDYYSKKPLSVKEVKENMGATTDTVYFQDMDAQPQQQVVHNEARIFEIQSLIFIENWYIDMETLRMKKEVTGIAPVRYYYPYGEADGPEIVSKVPFMILFNNN